MVGSSVTEEGQEGRHQELPLLRQQEWPQQKQRQPEAACHSWMPHWSGMMEATVGWGCGGGARFRN